MLVIRVLLVRFGFGLNDVGIGTCVAIESPDPVVVERVRSQTSYGEASYFANIQIVVGSHESNKRVGKRNVQAVASRTADTGPVCTDAAGSFIAVL